MSVCDVSFCLNEISLSEKRNKVVAIKIIDLDASDDEISDIQVSWIPMHVRMQMNLSQEEIRTLADCRSPFCVDYYESFLDEEKLHIVMEYMSGGSMAEQVISSSKNTLQVQYWNKNSYKLEHWVNNK